VAVAGTPSGLLLHEKHFFSVIDLGELDLDDFIARGLDVSPDERGRNGQLAVSAVDEYTELNPAGASVGEKRVQRRTNGASGEQNVIDQHNVLSVDIHSDIRCLHDRPWAQRGKVVAVKGDVQGADRNGLFLHPFHDAGEALGDRDASAANANQCKTIQTTVLFDDLVRQANQSALDFGCGHELRLLAQSGGGGGILTRHERLHDTRACAPLARTFLSRFLRFSSGLAPAGCVVPGLAVANLRRPQ